MDIFIIIQLKDFLISSVISSLIQRSFKIYSFISKCREFSSNLFVLVLTYSHCVQTLFSIQFQFLKFVEICIIAQHAVNFGEAFGFGDELSCTWFHFYYLSLTLLNSHSGSSRVTLKPCFQVKKLKNHSASVKGRV